MSEKKRALLVCLAVLGVVLAVSVLLVGLNRDAALRRVAEFSRQADATLFRAGEIYSIGHELMKKHGSRPELSYTLAPDGRILEIAFDHAYELPRTGTAEEHARAIALYALSKTKKAGRIDRVDVRFERDGAEPAIYAFSPPAAERQRAGIP